MVLIAQSIAYLHPQDNQPNQAETENSVLMDNHASLTKVHQHLRWKLTLSYTGVTVGALLTVEFVLLVILSVGLVVLLNSGSLPALLIETASVDYAPTLRFYLAQTPPDQAGIADWLEHVGPASSATLPLTFEATDEMLVVGRDGRLLGVKPPDLLESDLIGQPLDFRAIPGLADPLQAALTGEEDVDQLYTLANPGNKIVMTVPIWDAAHEQVLGVLVAMVRSHCILRWQLESPKSYIARRATKLIPSPN